MGHTWCPQCMYVQQDAVRGLTSVVCISDAPCEVARPQAGREALDLNTAVVMDAVGSLSEQSHYESMTHLGSS